MQCTIQQQPCRNRSLEVRAWPTSSIQTINQQAFANFIPVLSPVVTPPSTAYSGTSFGNYQVHSFSVSLPSSVDGLYVAILDYGGCTRVDRVNVTYHFCLPAVINSVSYPQTISGAFPTLVVGLCEGLYLVPKGGVPVSLNCSVSGTWDLNSQVGNCVCDAGYENTSSGDCQECNNNFYKSVATEFPCLPCPANSESGRKALNCTCKSGAYRLPAQPVSAACTKPPAQLQDGSITVVAMSNSANISWVLTSDNGGRSDVTYSVDYRRSSASIWVDLGLFTSNFSSNGTFSIFETGLLPFTDYLVRVFVANGVSNMAGITQSQASVFAFKTGESVPSGPPLSVSFSKLRLGLRVNWKPPAVPNGVITSYKVHFTLSGGDVKHEVTVSGAATHLDFTDLNHTAEYFAKVAASTAVGAGPYSEEVSGMPGGPEFTTPPPTNPPDSPGSSSNTAAIAGGAAAGGVLAIVLIIVVIIILWRKGTSASGRKHAYSISVSLRRSSNASGVTTNTKLSLKSLRSKHNSGSSGHDDDRIYQDPSDYGDPQAALSEFTRELNPHLISIKKTLGEGEFGEVCLGVMKTKEGPVQVAMKTLKPGADQKTKMDFLMEASIMGQFRHKNIIKLIGICSRDRNRATVIVMEYAEDGSLYGYLKNNPRRFSPVELMSMAEGVVAGMQYLSSINFIHRDLAARNILVAANQVCKISDFGLSREALDDNAYEVKKGGKLPIRWTAPEAILYRKFTTYSDVWSFGVLLWEIMSCSDRPYWNWGNTEVMDALLKKGYRLPAPRGCPTIVHDLMLQCWHKDPLQRPSFGQIHKNIVALRKSGLVEENLDVEIDTRAPVSVHSTIDHWLDSLNLSSLASCFSSLGYSKVEECVYLGKDDLDALGITDVSQQDLILESLREHRQNWQAGYTVDVR